MDLYIYRCFIFKRFYGLATNRWITPTVEVDCVDDYQNPVSQEGTLPLPKKLNTNDPYL